MTRTSACRHVVVAVQDEGVLAGIRDTLNFVGEGVAAVDNPPQNRVDVTANGDIIVQDEGVATGTRRRVNFTGAGVVAADNAPQNRVDVTVPGYTPPNPELSIDLIDDFIAGTIEDGEVGELGWKINGTGPTVSVQDAPNANNLGIFRLNSSATIDRPASFSLFNNQLSYPFLFGVTTLEVTFIVKYTENTNAKFIIGFDDDLNSDSDRNRAEFEFDTAIPDTNWMCVTGDVAAATRTNSGVAFAVDTWFKLKIIRNSAGNWEFYINDSLVATNTTNLPTTTAGCNVGLSVWNRAAVSKSLDVDYARIKATVAR